LGRALRLLQPLVIRQRLFGAGDTGAGCDKSLPVYKCPPAAPAAAPSEDAPRQQVQESCAQSEAGQCRSYTYLTVNARFVALKIHRIQPSPVDNFFWFGDIMPFFIDILFSLSSINKILNNSNRIFHSSLQKVVVNPRQIFLNCCRSV